MSPFLETPGVAIVVGVVAVFLALFLQGFFSRAVSLEVGSIKAEFERGNEGVERVRGELTEQNGNASGDGSAAVDEPHHGEDQSRLGRDLQRLVAERDRLVEAFDQRNEVLLKDYHAHGLAQSRVAFQFSLVFASLGFLLIAGSVVMALIDTAQNASIPALVSGTVVEAIAGLFFVQSNRARDVMTSFFEKARIDRSLSEALRLADEVPDKLIRSRLQTVLALRLADADATDDVIRTVMAAGEGPGVGDMSTTEPERALPTE